MAVHRGGFLVWWVLAATLLVLLNLPLTWSRSVKAGIREALAPLHSLVSRTAFRVAEAADALRGLGGLAVENRALQEEILRLRAELRASQWAVRENEELRALVGFRTRTAYRVVAAEVIARDSTGWWQSLRLDRGRLDGLTPDLPVMTPDGLAGRTVEVSDHTADVLLISDPSCRVSVRLPRTDSFGVLRGSGVRWDGRVLCRVDFLNPGHPIRPGDEVVTSGLGGVFPPGLLIGHVESVQSDATGIHRRAIVLPSANLGAMRQAFVMLLTSDERSNTARP